MGDTFLNKTGQIISTTHEDEDAEDRADTGPELELRHLVFDPAHHGMRLDRALVDLVPEFSRSYLQQLIELGGVTVNNSLAAKPSARVKGGDTGVVELRPTPQSLAFKPEPMALEVVYEDEHLLVIDKPAGLVVHPAPGNWTGTLLNGLLAYDDAAMHLPRAGIVHRLDKDTSGLMVVARTRPVMDALVRAIAAREVARQYLAVVHKPWVGSRNREISAPMGRDPRNRLRMAVVDLDKTPGKLARTDVACLDGNATGCLVRCTLHTGRTHQIRVHMASIGHPLLADVLYGGVIGPSLQRQALHAYRLAFAHPVTGQSMEFHAPLPGDLQQALLDWSLSYNGE
jgi:23S rRNA pseudouridine1911/1915/1917 synthase